MTLDARAEILRLRASGLSDNAIAKSLTRRGIPTSSGRGIWHHSTVAHAADPATWAAYMRAYRRPRS